MSLAFLEVDERLKIPAAYTANSGLTYTASIAPNIMRVQLNKGCSVPWGSTMPTSWTIGIFSKIKGIPSAHQEVVSTSE